MVTNQNKIAVIPFSEQLFDLVDSNDGRYPTVVDRLSMRVLLCDGTISDWP